ncbi:hypothetical protein [Pseudoalteromonas phage vB_PtuP_Slicky01]|nr:hypothetical protein [Pseudoalteromonas phage vB_PtuP_Slicky01]
MIIITKGQLIMITLEQVKAQSTGAIEKTLEGVEALEAVKQDGWALRFVRKQTPEICLAAVKQSGWALQFVREQTPEICLAAVKEDSGSIKYVDTSVFEPETLEI